MATTPDSPQATPEWHRLDVDQVLARLDTDPHRGLDDRSVAARRERSGPNELIEHGGKSPLRILWEQVASTLIVMLVVAAVVSFALGDFKDAIAILAILLLNAALGFSQEYRAERAMQALKKLSAPLVTVRRNGRRDVIPARDLVPGDVVLLEAGGIIPADCRIVESATLKIDESALTGESVPVEKSGRACVGSDTTLAERVCMAYAGTHVAYGRGQVVVVATGMATELGRIAELLQAVPRETTPLQARLDRMARSLAIIALAIVGIVVVQGLLQGEPMRLMFLTGVSLAVAAVPEGLPAVVTIALALGAQRLLRRHALIRKLPAVETLGSVTVICSDKTGTLTENRMSVTRLETLDQRVAFDTTGRPDRSLDDLGRLVVAGAALCTDAELDRVALERGTLRAGGDPTEAALVVVAAANDLGKDELERMLPRVTEVPFDSARKRMTTAHRVDAVPELLAGLLERLHAGPGSQLAFTKGALDQVLERCSHAYVGSTRESLTPAVRQRIAQAHDRLAAEGVRVLALAMRLVDPGGLTADALEDGLSFLGLIGMTDPPRPEVRSAVARCATAGIRPIMITGDHPLTARHIAAEIGIRDDSGGLTGHDLAAMSVETMEAIVDTTSIYARVAPEHKLKIVEALQRRGQVVAMTGDGVNDAPALKRANIGIAMGVTGTDVSKEASDVILRDDNFATIVAAVEEGRVVFDNIRKFIKYLLTTNSGELWVMLGGPLMGIPLPLLPLQILWINLVTDGLPAVALGVEPAEHDTMDRAPTSTVARLLDRPMLTHIVWVGLLIGLLSLGVGVWYRATGDARWQTMVFTTLTYAQLAHVMAIRSSRRSLVRVGILSNPALLGAVLLMVVLQLGVIYLPAWRTVFRTEWLSGTDLVLALGLSTIVFVAVEVEKWVLHRDAATNSTLA